MRQPVEHPGAVHEDALHRVAAVRQAAGQHLAAAAPHVHHAAALAPVVRVLEGHLAPRQAQPREAGHGVLEVVGKRLVPLLLIVLQNAGRESIKITRLVCSWLGHG